MQPVSRFDTLANHRLPANQVESMRWATEPYAASSWTLKPAVLITLPALECSLPPLLPCCLLTRPLLIRPPYLLLTNPFLVRLLLACSLLARIPLTQSTLTRPPRLLTCPLLARPILARPPSLAHHWILRFAFRRHIQEDS